MKNKSRQHLLKKLQNTKTLFVKNKMFDQLPNEMIREIFSFSGKWWLKRNMQLVNIEKLFQIKIPTLLATSSYNIQFSATSYRVLLPITAASSYELRYTYWRERFDSFYVIHNTNFFGNAYCTR